VISALMGGKAETQHEDASWFDFNIEDSVIAVVHSPVSCVALSFFSSSVVLLTRLLWSMNILNPSPHLASMKSPFAVHKQ
jgi:hypothetical protein